MRPEAFDEEVDAVKSYEKFLKNWERKGANEIVLTTLENKVMVVAVTVEGWTFEHEAYPTLESLLMSKSPLFMKLWDAELALRLNRLDSDTE